MAKKEKDEEEKKSQDFIQTVTSQQYNVFFKGFMYEFRFHPQKTIDDNIEAIEYLLKHAKGVRDREKKI